MKKIKTLILIATVALMATSCGVIYPESGYGYGYGNRYDNRYDNRYGNNGNAYGNQYGNGLRKGMSMNEVVRMYGRPYDSRTYYNGRNRMDILYYREAVRSGGRMYYTTTQMEFKNSYLHKVKRSNKNASNSRRRGYDNGNRAYRRY